MDHFSSGKKVSKLFLKNLLGGIFIGIIKMIFKIIFLKTQYHKNGKFSTTIAKFLTQFLEFEKLTFILNGKAKNKTILKKNMEHDLSYQILNLLLRLKELCQSKSPGMDKKANKGQERT